MTTATAKADLSAPLGSRRSTRGEGPAPMPSTAQWIGLHRERTR